MKIRLEKIEIKDGYNIFIDDDVESNFDVTRCWQINRQNRGLTNPVWRLREWRDECWDTIEEWRAPNTENLSPDNLDALRLRVGSELAAHLIKLTPEQLDGERTVRNLPEPMRQND